MTPLTQQELEVLRDTAIAANNFWPSNQEQRNFRDTFNPGAAIRLLDLIAARDKEIAELKAQVGLANEIGFRDTDVNM